MGLILSSFLEQIMAKFNKKTTVLVLGLDNAGKTQILYCMKMGMAIEHTVPTLGFNIEEFKYKNLTFKAWDIGGQTKFRSMWHHYFEGVDAVIYVIDSADRQRFPESKKELQSLLEYDQLRTLPFLVFANKQDLPHAAEIVELKSRFEWHLYGKTNAMHMIGCCAVRNEKISVGLDWLANAVL